MACSKEIKIYTRGKSVPFQCGWTGPHGSVELCDDCKVKLKKEYPQGWRSTPGDICKHGNYVGDPYGVDYLCARCEEGA